MICIYTNYTRHHKAQDRISSLVAFEKNLRFSESCFWRCYTPLFRGPNMVHFYFLEHACSDPTVVKYGVLENPEFINAFDLETKTLH